MAFGEQLANMGALWLDGVRIAWNDPSQLIWGAEQFANDFFFDNIRTLTSADASLSERGGALFFIGLNFAPGGNLGRGGKYLDELADLEKGLDRAGDLGHQWSRNPKSLMDEMVLDAAK
ncbi:MAG: hypothetical protein ACYCXJ_08970, partial [Thermoleophilia bacterium]